MFILGRIEFGPRYSNEFERRRAQEEFDRAIREGRVAIAPYFVPPPVMPQPHPVKKKSLERM